MNAFATPPVAQHEAEIEPGHRAILTYVFDHAGLSESAFRHDQTLEAQDARAMYFWLCDQLKSTGFVANGFAAGISPEDAPSEILRIDRMRGSDRALADALNEACLVLHCEAALLIQKGFARSHEPSIASIARKALSSPRAAGMVPVVDIQRLAGAYLGLSSGIELRQARAEIAALVAERGHDLVKIEELRGLVRARSRSHPLEDELTGMIRAGDTLDRASQAAQPAARRAYEKATEQLRSAAETFFGIERKFK
jgi:hypothetical protein